MVRSRLKIVVCVCVCVCVCVWGGGGGGGGGGGERELGGIDLGPNYNQRENFVQKLLITSQISTVYIGNG